MILNGAIALGTMLLTAAGPADATRGRQQFVALLTARTPGQQVSALATGVPGPLTPRQFTALTQQRRLILQQQALITQVTRLAGLTSPNPFQTRRIAQIEARTLSQLQRNLQLVQRQIFRLSQFPSGNPRVRSTIASLQNQAALLTFQTIQLQNRMTNPPPIPDDRPPATPSS